MDAHAASEPSLLALVVVPEPQLRGLIASVLAELGFSIVEGAPDAQAAGDAVSRRPNLVVVDTDRSGAGPELCIALSKEPRLRGAPMIAIADRDDEELIAALFEAGITDLVAKPISRPVVAYRVRHVLQAEALLDDARSQEEILDDAQRIARLGHWKWDLSTGFMTWSEQTRRLLEAPEDLVDPQLTDFLARVHPDDVSRVGRFLEASLRGQTASDLDFRVSLPDDSERVLHARAETTLDATGRPQRVSGTLQDITQRKKAESRIRFLAFYDNLTGLPNRLQFRELLKKSLAAARRGGRMAAVMFMDLDNFKRINDTAGHSAGDRLLKAAAERLKQALRITDTVARKTASGFEGTVARVGGDEFIVLLPEISRPEDPAKVARRILEAFRAPFDIGGAEIFVSTSIGISIFPHDGGDPEDLLKNADVALYHAKDAGRNNFQFFSPAQNDAAFRRLSLESSLRKAVERNELILHYQPQVLAREGRLIGTEALVRWNHPDLGIVYPGQFIPLAEETGLIQAIDEWVLRTACEQNAAWQRAGLPPVHVAVNLSGHEFRRVDFLERVDAIVAGAGLEPRHVELEITEGILMEHAARTMEILNALKGRGFRIAVDDFGTGYSSLAYLKRFRADVLKIDRSFVRDVASSPDDAAIVTAIVTLAHTLKMSVIAEGVENSLQRAFLHEQGCELMQGHLFGKPVPPDAIGELLRLQSAEAEAAAVALVESEAVPSD